jgi:hypothetical protein
LDLLQLTAGSPAPRCCSTEVMGRDYGNSYGPNNCQMIFSVTPALMRPPRFTGRNTNPSAITAAVTQASIAALTQVDEIDYASTTILLLDVLERESRHSVTEKDREYRPVPQTLSGFDVHRQWLSLHQGQAVLSAPGFLAPADHYPGDTGSLRRREHAVVSCLANQFPDGCQPDVDQYRAELPGFQGYSPGGHGGRTDCTRDHLLAATRTGTCSIAFRIQVIAHLPSAPFNAPICRKGINAENKTTCEV